MRLSTVLASAILFAFPASLDAAVRSVLVGMDANPAANQSLDLESRRDRFQLSVDAGVTHIYLHPIWNSIEPLQSTYDFSDVDFQTQLADQNNIPISLNIRLIDTTARALPASYSDLSFDDPRLIQAFIDLLRAMAPHLHGRVRWIGLGNEVDSYLSAHQAEIGPYSQFIRNVTPAVRELFPNVQVSVNFTYNASPFLNNLFSPITTLVDFYSFTYYPLNADFTLRDPSVVWQEITEMVTAAGDKPVLFQEIGYASSSILNGSEEKQATFLKNVFGTLSFYAGKVVAANFVWLSDLPQSRVDELTAYYGEGNPNFREFLATLGYCDLTGRMKPAWFVFKQNAPSLVVNLDQPGVSLVSDSDSSQNLKVGFARLSAGEGSAPVAGLSILSLRQNGVTVAEASVPASIPVSAGRMYVEVNTTIKTGLAVANTNDKQVFVSFSFIDENGNNRIQGTFVIPAFGQVSGFLDQSPFNLGSSVKGTLTFFSSDPISSVTVRLRTNERSELIFTTIEVSDLSSTAGTKTIPQFVDGGGSTSEIILVNPTGGVINGTLRFFDTGDANRAAQPLTVSTDRSRASEFRYQILPNSFWSVKTLGASASSVNGSIRIVPDARNSAPSGVALLSLRSGGVTVSEASVYAIRPAPSFRLFVESSKVRAVETGVAVANASNVSISVQLEMLNLDGSATGRSASVTIPANGQIAAFTTQISGLGSGLPFQGILRVSSGSSLVSVAGMRGRYNERGDFLMSTVFPVDESQPSPSTLVFPHLGYGGGLNTQFVVYNQTSATFFSGNLRFFSQSGDALNIRLNSNQ